METTNWDEKPGTNGPAGEEQARSRPTLEDAKARLHEINERIKGFIRERPTACLAGALALGYLVARVARRSH